MGKLLPLTKKEIPVVYDFILFLIVNKLLASNWLAVYHTLLTVSDEALPEIILKNVRVNAKYIKKALNKVR